MKAGSSQGREDVVSEIDRLKLMIQRFNEGKLGQITNFNYPEAIKRLQYLRNRLRMYGKSAKVLRRNRIEEDTL